MTRKRFIKLLMSTGDWDRNSANMWVKSWKASSDWLKRLKAGQKQESFYSALWSFEVDCNDLLSIGYISAERFVSDKDFEGLDKEAQKIYNRMPYGGFGI